MRFLVITACVLYLAACGNADQSAPTPFDLAEPEPTVACTADVGVKYYGHVRGPEYWPAPTGGELRYLTTHGPHLISALETEPGEKQRCLRLDIVTATPRTCEIRPLEPDAHGSTPYPNDGRTAGDTAVWFVAPGRCVLRSEIAGTDETLITQQDEFTLIGELADGQRVE